MAKQKTSGKQVRPAPKPQREVDKLFAQYAACHQHPTNKLLQWIFTPLFFLGFYGLLWVAPFPHPEFLGKNNEYFNWASFFLAAGVFYYYKLSPVLSYFIMFTLFLYSLIITSLEKWQHTTGGALWQISVVIFVVGLTGMFLGYQAERKNPGFKVRLTNMMIAPGYLWHIFLKKFSVKV